MTNLETLTGLATIRAYREQVKKRFLITFLVCLLFLNFGHHQNRVVKEAERGLDLENRAYYMTISIQRWLTLRLDLLGNMLVLGIALFAAGFRHTINPAIIGVVLSYTLSSKYCHD